MRPVGSKGEIRFQGKVLEYLKDAVALLFPELCTACQRALVSQEQFICTHCIFHLPLTHFHLDPNNLAARQLSSRIQLLALASFFYYSGGSSVQRIIHSIKYQKGFALAEYLGLLYGEQLKTSEGFASCNMVIPVPLHKKRLRWRGYNQSEYFARGLAHALSIEIYPSALIRKAHLQSQTESKTRLERFENMDGLFEVDQPERLENKHILLVDDVLTTGATLEACSIPLLKIKGVRLSIATIAFTKR